MRRPDSRLRVIALLAFLAWSCGGSGGGPSQPPPPPPPPPPPTIVFTSDGVVANSLALTEMAGTGREVLFLSLDASQVTDLFGVAFDLDYPANRLEFVNASEGSFLDTMAGMGTSFQLVENVPGTLVIGLTRLGDVGGADGSGDLILFEFSRVAAGNGSFSFSANTALDSEGAISDQLVWVAGSVNVPQ